MDATKGWTREALLAQANEQNADLPQYRGYFDHYRLVGVIRRDVRTKLGLAFKKGDVVLGCYDVIDGDNWPFAYSFRNQISTALRDRDVRWIPTMRLLNEETPSGKATNR